MSKDIVKVKVDFDPNNKNTFLKLKSEPKPFRIDPGSIMFSDNIGIVTFQRVLVDGKQELYMAPIEDLAYCKQNAMVVSESSGQLEEDDSAVM